jgi:hypothetical protein
MIQVYTGIRCEELRCLQNRDSGRIKQEMKFASVKQWKFGACCEISVKAFSKS